MCHLCLPKSRDSIQEHTAWCSEVSEQGAEVARAPCGVLGWAAGCALAKGLGLLVRGRGGYDK